MAVVSRVPVEGVVLQVSPRTDHLHPSADYATDQPKGADLQSVSLGVVELMGLTLEAELLPEALTPEA